MFIPIGKRAVPSRIQDGKILMLNLRKPDELTVFLLLFFKSHCVHFFLLLSLVFFSLAPVFWSLFGFFFYKLKTFDDPVRSGGCLVSFDIRCSILK